MSKNKKGGPKKGGSHMKSKMHGRKRKLIRKRAAAK